MAIRQFGRCEHALTAKSRSRGENLAVVRVLSAEYGLNALALVPHMVFLVDFVARGLARESMPARITGCCMASAPPSVRC